MLGLKEKLITRFYTELPGFKAQAELAPEGRFPAERALMMAGKNPKMGSVMAILTPNLQNDYSLVFIKRPAYDGVHGGQISFPGGKLEKGDKNPLQTAIRETFEEIGVKPDTYTICGNLTEIYIPPSNFWVYPFLGVSEKPLTFLTDTREVEYVLQIPISEIISNENLAKTTFQTIYGKLHDYPCFAFGNQIIWGATAMITSEIKTLIKELV